ncbi:MAG: DUF3570 domain-containing protein [Methyloprofundus sp.]|nr:DUF3570 domain-containing protein [Methyloprofundus sp.]
MHHQEVVAVGVINDANSMERKNIAKSPRSIALQALTSAALILPGLVVSPAKSVADDTVSMQYNYFNEGARQLYNVPNTRAPIRADTFHLGSQISLTDRIKFAFDYTQDTWSGATPVTTSPLVAGGNHPIQVNTETGLTTVGASPIINSRILMDHQLTPLAQDPITGEILGTQTQLVHVLSSASPETRKQGDFSLAYEWDTAAVNVGGGLSLENDYESYYGSIGGRWDVNKGLTTLKSGLSYSQSNTQAILDHDASPYITKTAYADQLEFRGGSEILHGNKEDWSSNFGITQILNKTAFVDINLGYIHSSGFMENPYKTMAVVFIDPNTVPTDPNIPIFGDVRALLEQRPDKRNQISLATKYVQYIEPFNAALHLGYQYSHDDWGVNAHTFEAEWVQPLGRGWTVTPRVRYYSQNAANFYQPYLTSAQAYNSHVLDEQGREIWVDASNPNNGVEYHRDESFNLIDSNGQIVDESVLNVINKTEFFDPTQLPEHFTSDQRLSGYGAISAGITISKLITKGLTLQGGFDYYSHAGSLKLGGGGEGSYSNFDSISANAAVIIDLNTLSAQRIHEMHGDHSHHAQHSGHTAPAGVMYSHMLPNADDIMVGYRYMYGRKAGAVLHGTDRVNDLNVVNNGCSDTIKCRFIQPYMEMSMHMINIMYAPTDWLNLMIMPTFVDMEMNLRDLNGRPPPVDGVHEHTGIGGHTTGGVGDTVLTSLFKLYDQSGHHLHLGLGVSAPTGDVGLKFRRIAREDPSIVHFGMQLGSGTWDFLPSLTYTGESNDWAWGAQIKGEVRMQTQNESGYRLGNELESSAWGSYKFTEWLSGSVRGVYSTQSSIKGDFNSYSGRVGPMDFPANHGGHFGDIGFGLNASIPQGDLVSNSFAFEWLQPILDSVNGYQLQRQGALTASWSYAF